MSLGYAIAHALAAATAGAADALNKTNFVEQIGRSHQEAVKLAAGDLKLKDSSLRIYNALPEDQQKRIGSPEDAVAMGPTGMSQVLGAWGSSKSQARQDRDAELKEEDRRREDETRAAELVTLRTRAQGDPNALSYFTGNGERPIDEVSLEELRAGFAYLDERSLQTERATRGAFTASGAAVTRINAIEDIAKLQLLLDGDPAVTAEVLDFSGIPHLNMLGGQAKNQITVDVAQAAAARMKTLHAQKNRVDWRTGNGAERREALTNARGNTDNIEFMEQVTNQATALSAKLPLAQSVEGGLESIAPYLSKTEEGRLLLAALEDFNPVAAIEEQGDGFLNMLGRVDPSRVESLVNEAKAAYLTVSQGESILPLLESVGMDTSSGTYEQLSTAIGAKDAEGVNKAILELSNPGAKFEKPLAEKIINELEIGLNLGQANALDTGIESLRSLAALRDFLGDKHPLVPQIDAAMKTVREQFDGDFFAEAWTKRERVERKKEIRQFEDLLGTLALNPEGDQDGRQIWRKGPDGQWSPIQNEVNDVFFATADALNTWAFDLTRARVLDSYKTALRRDLKVSQALIDAGVDDDSKTLSNEIAEDRALLENLEKTGGNTRFEQAFDASRGVIVALGKVSVNFPIYRSGAELPDSALEEARTELAKALKLVKEDDMGGQTVDDVVQRMITEGWLYSGPSERLQALRSAISSHVPTILRQQMGGESLSGADMDFMLDVWDETSRNLLDFTIGVNTVGLDPEIWEGVWEDDRTNYALGNAGELPPAATKQSGGWWSWFKPDSKVDDDATIDDVMSIIILGKGLRQEGVEYEIRDGN